MSLPIYFLLYEINYTLSMLSSLITSSAFDKETYNLIFLQNLQEEKLYIGSDS